MGLDHKEVDKLMDVADDGVKSLSGDGVVLARAQLGSQAVAKDRLPGSLGKNGDTQSHPGKLEAVSEKVEVSSREDDRDDAGVGDARGT